MLSTTSTAGRRRRWRLTPFVAWLALFYIVWAALVIAGDHVQHIIDHWQIALAMLGGSYIAGSTPMGGGTVGFPVLVLLLEQSTDLGRDFSFVIQAVGMTSASIFILCRRQKLAMPLLPFAMLGVLVGTPLGLWLWAPLVPPIGVKLVFAIIWASFGIMTLYKLREFSQTHGMTHTPLHYHAIAGLIVGVGGGFFVSSITGVGVDMLVYTALILLWRTDLRIAIPTSVTLMAFTSLVGTGTRFVMGGLSDELYYYWLAAAPVVALGAPLGAFVVTWVGRTPTLAFVAVLCLLQFVWTYYHDWHELGWIGLLGGLGGLAICNLAFHLLYLNQFKPTLPSDVEGNVGQLAPEAEPAAGA